MTTIKKFGKIVIRIHKDDHNPPHFHIDGPDCRAMIAIKDMSIMRGHLSDQGKQALEWAAGNKLILKVLWKSLNEE